MNFFKTPPFWYRGAGSKAGFIERALIPLSYLYDAGQNKRRSLTHPQSAVGPVVCVGNIVAGGSGKTPAVAALQSLLLDSGVAQSPFILSRGYGGRLAGPVMVDPRLHTAADVGDEPLLLASRGAEVAVSKDRVAGACYAFAHGADLVLMDDGFQSPTLKKDISFLVIDGGSGFGNGRLLPAGPLRESPDSAMARAQAVIMIGPDEAEVRSRIRAALPVFTAHIMPASQPDSSLRYIGFAGLGRPEKFRKTLETLGLRVVEFYDFADHHAYDLRDIKRLRGEARARGSTLITTEKDYVRLPPELREGVEFLPINLIFDAPNDVIAFLRAGIARARNGLASDKDGAA